MPSSDRFRRPTVAALILGAVVLLSAATGVATAQPVRGVSGSVVVAEGETVEGIDAVTGSVVVRGTVSGDINGLAGTIHVADGGRVEGSISAATGDLRIDGTVEGNVNAGSGRIEVSETGRIGGDLVVGAETILVNGAVDGDVRAGAERLVLGPNATVGGQFRYDANEFTRDPAATVEGRIVRDPDIRGNFGVFAAPNWVTRVYGLFANLLLGAVLLAVFPAFSSTVALRVEDRPVNTGGVGLLALLATPLALVLFAVTIIGIPLALLGAILYGLAIWVGIVYGEYAVGAWVLGRAGRDNRWLALVAGLVGFAILGAVPILGGFLEFGALLLGLGALALGLRESYRARRRAGPRGRQATFDETFGRSTPEPADGTER